MLDTSGQIGVLYVDLFIPEAQSLKDKRMVLRAIKDRVRNKFNVSIGEIEGQDKWQVARLGFSMINSDAGYIDRALSNIFSLIDTYHKVEVTDSRMEFF